MKRAACGEEGKTRQKCHYTSYVDRYQGVFDVVSLVAEWDCWGRKIQQCSKNKAKLVRNDELCFECIGAGSCVDVLCGRRLCLQRRLICRGSRRELTIFRTQEAWMIVRRCELPRLA